MLRQHCGFGPIPLACAPMTPMKPIHVIGGGLAGSEAAWQIAPAPACPSCCTRCARPRMTDAHKTDGLRRARLLQLVPLRRLGEQRRRPAARGDAPRRLAHHGGRRPAQAAGRRRARRRSRRLLRRGHRTRSRRIRSSPSMRGEIAGLPPADWDSVIIATGPLTSPALERRRSAR